MAKFDNVPDTAVLVQIAEGELGNPYSHRLKAAVWTRPGPFGRGQEIVVSFGPWPHQIYTISPKDPAFPGVSRLEGQAIRAVLLKFLGGIPRELVAQFLSKKLSFADLRNAVKDATGP